VFRTKAGVSGSPGALEVQALINAVVVTWQRELQSLI